MHAKFQIDISFRFETKKIIHPYDENSLISTFSNFEKKNHHPAHECLKGL